MSRTLKLLIWVGGFLFVLAGVNHFIEHKAYAYSAAANGGSNIVSTGTFDGSGFQTGSSIPASVNDAASFKNYIGTILNGGSAYGIPGSYYNRTGAAFIVETMLHGQHDYNADDGLIGTAQAEYATWASYVDQYAAAGRISWFQPNTYGGSTYINSEHVCTKAHGACNDRAVYNGSQDAHQLGFFATRRSEGDTLITFVNPDGSTFSIRRGCANVLGGVSPITNLNQLPVGSYDAATCTFTSGWMYDPDSPGTSIQYYVNVNGVTNGPFVANKSRGDLGGLPGGNIHAFSDNPAALSGFNPRRTDNTIQYVGVDAQTGAQKDFGTKTVGPCITAACGNSTFPSDMSVGVIQSFVVSVDLSGDWGPPYTTSDPAMSVTVHDPSGIPVVNGPVAYTAGSPPGTHLTSAAVNFTPATAGTYTVQWSLTGGVLAGSALNVNCGFGSPGAPPGTPNKGDAGYQPYISMLGGDIAAGPGVGSGCTPNASAGILTYNYPANARRYFSSSQLGGLALGDMGAAVLTNIKGFSTSQNSDGTDSGAGVPGGLAFANTGGTFGNFGLTNWCGPDYYSKAGPNTGGSDLSAGTHVHGSGITLGGGTVSGNVTVVVKGDVRITGDIKYGSYSAISGIPQFRLLVTGNIYVDPGVRILSGFYDAQPNGAVGGTFATCADSSGPITTYDACKFKLTVNGAVSAAKLVLGRTYGNPAPDVTTGTLAEPAETFQFSPELWLPSTVPANCTVPTDPACQTIYESITSLPPVL